MSKVKHSNTAFHTVKFGHFCLISGKGYALCLFRPRTSRTQCLRGNERLLKDQGHSIRDDRRAGGQVAKNICDQLP
jgi:hypothetical protein